MAMPNMLPQMWTAEMARRLLPDDGNRYEVIDGVLHVTPSPGMPHQAVSGQLYRLLTDYLERFGQEKTVLYSPADISWTKHTLVQPDLFVLRQKEFLTGQWKAVKHLLLAVEILSPSSRRRDLVIKRDLYRRYGVEEYWVVDIPARAIHVWRRGDRDGTVVRDTLTWRPSSVPSDAAPLVLDIAALFHDLPGGGVDEEEE
jgi:Uma2 family endonuclease